MERDGGIVAYLDNYSYNLIDLLSKIYILFVIYLVDVGIHQDK